MDIYTIAFILEWLWKILRMTLIISFTLVGGIIILLSPVIVMVAILEHLNINGPLVFVAMLASIIFGASLLASVAYYTVKHLDRNGKLG